MVYKVYRIRLIHTFPALVAPYEKFDDYTTAFEILTHSFVSIDSAINKPASLLQFETFARMDSFFTLSLPKTDI